MGLEDFKDVVFVNEREALKKSLIKSLSDSLHESIIDRFRVMDRNARTSGERKLIDELRTSFQSRFSVPFGLASIIYHGRSGLAPFEQAAVDNPKIQALTQRVDLREDESFTARYPQEQPVTVRITMRGGAVHEGRCVVTKGEPGNPHKPEELTAKFFELGEPVWGNQTTKSLYDGLMRIEDIADFRAFADGFKL